MLCDAKVAAISVNLHIGRVQEWEVLVTMKKKKKKRTHPKAYLHQGLNSSHLLKDLQHNIMQARFLQLKILTSLLDGHLLDIQFCFKL